MSSVQVNEKQTSQVLKARSHASQYTIQVENQMQRILVQLLARFQCNTCMLDPVRATPQSAHTPKRRKVQLVKNVNLKKVTCFQQLYAKSLVGSRYSLHFYTYQFPGLPKPSPAEQSHLFLDA